MLNSKHFVNYRPLTLLSDDPKDYSAITPSSLLTPAIHPSTPMGAAHHKDDLRRDYHFNVALVHRFWERWIKCYLPLLQRRKMGLKTVDNLHVGQMVLVAGLHDIHKQGNYKLGRVSKVLPHIRKGKALKGRASMTVSNKTDNGQAKITYVERDLSKLAPLEMEDESDYPYT